MREFHGQKGTPLYAVWQNMKGRCLNKNRRDYKYYGGREIKFCDEWESFKPFYKWAIRSGYDPSLEIDRKNNDEDYTPENCRFVTRSENMKNTRPSKIWLVYDTIFLTARDAAKFWSVSHWVIGRWCIGYKMRGKIYPPKPNCKSIKMYY